MVCKYGKPMMSSKQMDQPPYTAGENPAAEAQSLSPRVFFAPIPSNKTPHAYDASMQMDRLPYTAGENSAAEANVCVPFLMTTKCILCMLLLTSCKPMTS
eukprot:1159194-Pelagomonas_calceolata.AAC.5